MKKTIGVWDDDDYEKTYNTLLVKRRDLENYNSICDEIEKPLDIIIVEPNGYEIIDFLVCYVSYMHGDNYLIDDNDFNSNYRAFIKSVSCGDILAAKTFKRNIEKYIPLRFRSFHKILNYYLIFSEKILLELSRDTAYVSENRSEMQNIISFENNKYLDSLNSIAELTDEITLVHDEISVKYKPVISSLKKTLSKMKSDDKEISYFYMSIYFYILAKINNVKCFRGGALLLLFRSIEYFFISIGFKERSLIVNNNGEIRYYNNASEKVYLYGLIHTLPRMQNIMFDDATKSHIITLNNIRNKLYLTHGFYNIEQEYIESALNGVSRIIARYDENNKWLNIVSSIVDGGSFRMETPIESEKIFSSYLCENNS